MSEMEIASIGFMNLLVSLWVFLGNKWVTKSAKTTLKGYNPI